MTLPSNAEYKDAIQGPRFCFADSDLRSCEPYPGRHGLPWHATGNFGAVFRLRCPKSSRQWAVKCFTREVSADRGVRYKQIQSHFGGHSLPGPRRPQELVDFAYVAPGIRVRGTWYPIIKMEYVDSDNLSAFVERHLGNSHVLADIAALWLRLSIALRTAKVAHGDLQHGNVKVLTRPSGVHELKLLDYDGIFIQSLAGHPPGEIGHENYQHPARLKGGAYNAEVDRFPNLVIYTTLRCLALDVGRPLWGEFNNGENLLFRKEDFQLPSTSLLFKRLLALGGPVRPLVGRLALASQGSLEQVPLLEDIVTNGRPVELTAEEERRLVALFPSTKKRSTPPPQGKPWWAGRTSCTTPPQGKPWWTQRSPSAPPPITNPGAPSRGTSAACSILWVPSWGGMLRKRLRKPELARVWTRVYAIMQVAWCMISWPLAFGGTIAAILFLAALYLLLLLWPLWALLALIFFLAS